MVIKNHPGSLIVEEVVFNPASVATIVAVEQDVTVAGVTTNCVLITVEPPATGLALGVASARIKSNGVVAVTFINPTAGALDMASGTWKFVYAKYK